MITENCCKTVSLQQTQTDEDESKRALKPMKPSHYDRQKLMEMRAKEH